MAVTIKVNGAHLSLVHKGSNGFVKNTLPDVCKTPSPGGPVPIPYPVIVSFAMNLRNGTKTVKADGGNMIAIKGSEFSRCIGDEPGTLGGVKSQTNMKEAKWILYSFDVKMDRKNACRLTDKMTMNHGNTVSLGGELQAAVKANPDNEDVCGPGNHIERIYYPEVPKSEWSPRARLEAMRANARTPGDLFEVAAAEHNIEAGHITRGEQLSRNMSDEERDRGASEDDQKIWAICLVCHHRREIDQATDRDSTVEVKSTSDAIEAGKQKQNNRALVERGKSVTYKAPPLARNKLDALKADGFKYIKI
jgi:hypothetical protein